MDGEMYVVGKDVSPIPKGRCDAKQHFSLLQVRSVKVQQERKFFT